MPADQHLSRIGGVAAIVGVVLLVAATLLHPLDAHPGDAPAAFAEYALDRFWVASHLGQLLGIVLIATALVALSWRLRAGRGGAWALLAGLAATATVSLAGALQAVDGIALKFMVDRWSAASADLRPLVFEAAWGVRQVEIGLASMMGAFFGLTVLLYGIAILLGSGVRAWIGVFGVLAGSAALASSIVQAHTGFSDIAMTTGMPSTLLVLLWTLCIGISLLASIRR